MTPAITTRIEHPPVQGLGFNSHLNPALLVSADIATLRPSV